jgi:dihydrofolate reductase
MKVRFSVFIATSLDGFISRENGDLDWLDDANKNVPEGEDCGYAGFISSIDCLVMGRHTFEKVLTFDHWPYDGLRVVVLSSTALGISEYLAGKVEVLNLAPKQVAERLSAEGVRHVYVDGGDTIRRFLDGNMIDDLTITVVPLVLGKGRSLFCGLNQSVRLSLVSVKPYDFGFVQSVYSVDRSKV